MIKNLTIFVVLNLAAVLIVGVATTLPQADYRLALTSAQPMVQAIGELASTAAAQFEAVTAVGEQADWYGLAILLTSVCVTAVAGTLMRATCGAPRTTGEWMPYIVLLPLTGALTALTSAMLVPYLVEANALALATTPHVEIRQLAKPVTALHGFLGTTGALVAAEWNWWLYLATATAFNLPAIVVAATRLWRQQNAKQDEGVTLVIIRASSQ